MSTIIKVAQTTFDIEHEIEVGGETRYITGVISFDKKGNGSVSIKIKSGALSYEESEINEIMNDAKAAIRAGYLKLRDLKEQHSREKEGTVGTGNLFDQEANVQTDEYITMKEQEELAAAQEHNEDKSNLFKKTVKVEPGSLVDKANQSRKERTLRKLEDDETEQATGERAAKV